MKVRIGRYYQPHRFERRSATSFAALRPEPDSDMARLQSALLDGRYGRGPRFPLAWTALAACVFLTTVLLVS